MRRERTNMSLCGTEYSGGLVRQMYKESRQDDAMVTMPSKLQKGLPRRTGSLCPECLKIVPATLYIDNGALMMKKTCKEHGEFQEVCWSDAELYLKAENWAFDGVGIANPQIPDAKVCPYECGLCNLHYSNTALCNIDLTNRCNLKCPICFANANAAGYVFEPTYEQIVYEFAVLRAQRPVPVSAIQFAGGEPTIYPQFHEIVRAAKEMGFAQILNFAIKNSDVVKGVNYQPVSLTGRIPDEDRRKLRYTLADLAYDLEQQTGYLGRDDWYPVPFVAPISELVSVLTGSAKTAFTSHPACGLASYLFLEEGKDPVPITRFIDVEGLMEDMWKLAQETKDKKIKFSSKAKALMILRKHFKADEAPAGMGLTKFLKILNQMFTKGDKTGAAEFSWSTMYVGGMHFQDNYNYDIERVKRCVIHYATPDGKVIPFCAYNTGPNFREEVEKKFAVPKSRGYPAAQTAFFFMTFLAGTVFLSPSEPVRCPHA